MNILNKTETETGYKIPPTTLFEHLFQSGDERKSQLAYEALEKLDLKFNSQM
jgi:hypothetical protein